jgi:hypothetical protein
MPDQVAPGATDIENHDQVRAEHGTIRVEAVEELASAEEERRLVRKLDRRILPITCLLYILSRENFLFSSLGTYPAVLSHSFLFTVCPSH